MTSKRGVGRGHEGGQVVPGASAPPGVVCQACGLKFSAFGYRLHRWTMPGTDRVLCVPEEELGVCFGMHAWPKSPRWYSLPKGWEVQARERLVQAMAAGTASVWQLRCVPMADGLSALELTALALRNPVVLRQALVREGDDADSVMSALAALLQEHGLGEAMAGP